MIRSLQTQIDSTMDRPSVSPISASLIAQISDIAEQIANKVFQEIAAHSTRREQSEHQDMPTCRDLLKSIKPIKKSLDSLMFVSGGALRGKITKISDCLSYACSVIDPSNMSLRSDILRDLDVIVSKAFPGPWEDMTQNDQQMLMSFVMKLSDEERKQLSSIASSIQASHLLEDLPMEESIQCLQTLCSYDNSNSNDAVCVLADIASFAMKGLSVETRIACMNSFAYIREDARYSAVHLMQTLCAQSAGTESVATIIQSVTKIATEVGPEGIESLRSFLPSDPNHITRYAVALILGYTKCPTELLAVTQQIFTPAMSVEEKARILYNILTISDPRELQRFCRVLQRLCSSISKGTYRDIDQLISGIKDIPERKRESAVTQALLLLRPRQNTPNDALRLTRAIGFIDHFVQENVDNITNTIRRLLADNISTEDIQSIIFLLRMIPRDERDALTAPMSHVITTREEFAAFQETLHAAYKKAIASSVHI